MTIVISRLSTFFKCQLPGFRFELSWPPVSVCPEPQKGEVKPRLELADGSVNLI